MPTVIEALFPTPVYVHRPQWGEIFLVQQEIDNRWEEIVASDQFETPNGWEDNVKTNIKTRYNSIGHYKLNNLKNYIDKHVRNYVEGTQAIEPEPIYMAHSWANITTYNEYQKVHGHRESVVSGAYYYKTSGKDGDLVFHNPVPFVDLELFPLGEKVNKYISYTPCVGMIVLFPGWLKHEVERNPTHEPRITFSFNYVYDNKAKENK